MDFIKFENPQYFYFLWGILLILIVEYLFSYFRKKKLEGLFSLTSQKKLLSSYSSKKRIIRLLTLILGYTMLVIALVNPQFGTKLIKGKRSGIDITVAIDLSRSMNATDISPSRLEKTKHAVSSLIKRLKGDRICLVGFTSSAFIQCPLTTDYDAALMFLEVMDPSFIPQDGTSIAEAILTSSKSFIVKENSHKLLIIISDGEDHEENIDQAVNIATKEGIKIFTVGVGSLQGVPIPLPQGGFLKDRSGQTVLTKLNQDILQKVARLGNGKFYLSSDTEGELELILKDIETIEKKDFDTKHYSEYESQYQFFLALAIILITINLLFSERRRDTYV